MKTTELVVSEDQVGFNNEQLEIISNNGQEFFHDFLRKTKLDVLAGLVRMGQLVIMAYEKDWDVSYLGQMEAVYARIGGKLIHPTAYFELEHRPSVWSTVKQLPYHEQERIAEGGELEVGYIDGEFNKKSRRKKCIELGRDEVRRVFDREKGCIRTVDEQIEIIKAELSKRANEERVPEITVNADKTWQYTSVGELIIGNVKLGKKELDEILQIHMMKFGKAGSLV